MLSSKIIIVSLINAGISLTPLNWPTIILASLGGFQIGLLLVLLIVYEKEDRVKKLAQQSCTTRLDKQSTISDHPNINTVAKNIGGGW